MSVPLVLKGNIGFLDSILKQDGEIHLSLLSIFQLQ